MKLELNMASVEILYEFAEAIVGVRKEVEQSILELYEAYARVQDDLGVHQPDFEEMLSLIGKNCTRFGEAVEVLVPKMRACAAAIEKYVQNSWREEDGPRAYGTKVKSLGHSERGNIGTGSNGKLWKQAGIPLGNFKIPRDLPVTGQKMVERPDGGRTYNTPSETGKSLDYHQGKEKDFQGTCGLCSCENILRLAGVNVTEQDILRFAKKNGLCEQNKKPEDNGGTSYISRQVILEAFGLSSSLLPQDVKLIGDAVSSGKGVIISVDAGLLWKRANYLNNLHAVTVTSVDYNAAGQIESFHICDSGSNEYDKIVSVAELQTCLVSHRKMNVTHQIIR